MQLDLYEVIHADENERKKRESLERYEREYADALSRYGNKSYEQIKAASLNPTEDQLQWKPWNIFKEYEKCYVKAIIPPHALSIGEQRDRTGNKAFDYSAVERALMKVWSDYTFRIWKCEQHGVDWVGAYQLLRQYRDTSTPILMRLDRLDGKADFIPECIVEICD